MKKSLFTEEQIIGQALDFIESQEPTLDMVNRVLILDGDGEVEPIDIP